MASKNYGNVYNILGWGDPYFAVNAQGHLCVKPKGFDTTVEEEIDVLSVVEAAVDLQSNGKAQFPVILRFPGVLKHRLQSLHEAFFWAINGTGYASRYQGVFPVKVNQNKAVIQDFVNFGHHYNYGLEAGSKPELLIAMSCLTNANPEAYLVCNGYKDEDYISLALASRGMRLNTIIVVEMEEEVDLILQQSSKLESEGIEPVIGLRAKLLTTIPGHFGSTSGKHGKFGLLEEKIYAVADKLNKLGKLHWLKLLHFHIGSMIPSTDTVGKAVREATGIYCNLVKMGAPMGTLDCGGGLGVDYDGTRSGSSDMSVAYGLQEYASAIVQAVRVTCLSNGLENDRHPVLCTESGRAMVSHHSMIILDTLSAIPEQVDDETSEQLLAKIGELSAKPTAIHGRLKTAVGAADDAWYAHAVDLKKHGIEMYKLGKKFSKRATADAATIYNYHMNLSVFSLTPDYWGIQQLFPIMPVNRLNEKPTVKGTLIDLTCDSDGKIDKFISGAETLPLHTFDKDKGEYYLAVLLSGAYQEALSSKHNLFGGPTLLRVESNNDADADADAGSFKIATHDFGPTTEAMIGTMRYDVDGDIRSVIEKRAEENNVWKMVEPLMKTALGTMPYLFKY